MGHMHMKRKTGGGLGGRAQRLPPMACGQMIKERRKKKFAWANEKREEQSRKFEKAVVETE